MIDRQTGSDQTGVSGFQADVAPAWKRLRVCYFEEDRILRVLAGEEVVFQLCNCDGPPPLMRTRRLSTSKQQTNNQRTNKDAEAS